MSDLIWNNFRVSIEEPEERLKESVIRKLKVPDDAISNFRILRRALDARKKPNLVFSYTLGFSLNIPIKEAQRILHRMPDIKQHMVEEPAILIKPVKKLQNRPVIVGTGPAGYFAALALARGGFEPIVLERGDGVDIRTEKVNLCWETGQLDPESNVQFGEGGAGTFSDGKLTTRIQDKRILEVLETFVKHGAPAEILFLAKPHIGTDILKNTVKKIREEIINLGGEVRFRSKVTGIKKLNGRLSAVIVNGVEEVPSEATIFAVGHSARDVYQFLLEQGVLLEKKSFAIGLRVEHPQTLINQAQYGVEEHPKLGPADYQLTYQDIATGRGAYAFCMCPGGQVVAATSEEGGVVTNGMSEYKRATGIANSALVVTVGADDFPDSNPLAGVVFQRAWEKRAFEAGGGNYHAPAQAVSDFLSHKVSNKFKLMPSYKPGILPVDLHTVLPSEVGNVLERALLYFDSKIKGFAGEQASLTGVETRTSAPLRIVRNELGESVSLPGLFPAGEGAGYAGGIMSAAVDGLRIAERLMSQFSPAKKI